MANDYSMADIAGLRASLGATEVAINSTSRKNNTDLDMTDFLKLMIVQLQSQTMDDTMDTSEMMNQMVQMQMVTAITNMTETNIMTYASSLVNKEVTIGIINGNELEERVVTVIGTGMSNGQQVIFGRDEKGNVETYGLNQIMAVGKLPPLEGIDKPGEDGDATQKPGEGGDATQKPGEGEGPDEPGDVEKPDEGGDATQTPGDTTDKPVDGSTGTENNPDKPEEGTDETVNPPEAVG